VCKDRVFNRRYLALAVLFDLVLNVIHSRFQQWTLPALRSNTVEVNVGFYTKYTNCLLTSTSRANCVVGRGNSWLQVLEKNIGWLGRDVPLLVWVGFHIQGCVRELVILVSNWGQRKANSMSLIGTTSYLWKGRL